MAVRDIVLGAAGGSTSSQLWVDDVFSSFVYTGNGSTQTITNGIDLAGKGGMVWGKVRSTTGSNIIRDTVRGGSFALSSDQTFGQGSGYSTTFNSDGYSDGTLITNGASFVSWTFRKAPKFFDCGTVTTNGSGVASFSHALSSSPGMVIFKATGAVNFWWVFHRSLTSNAYYLKLSTTDAQTNFGSTWITVDATTITTAAGFLNNSAEHVWYAFAHDISTDGIIQCGSFTTDGSGNATVNLGWEPQFLMVKRSDSGTPLGGWQIEDSMRGFSTPASGNTGPWGFDLYANTSAAEQNPGNYSIRPSATGFYSNLGFNASATYIYLAIRRPNKPPTTGTQVYNAIARTGTGAAATVTGVGFAPDWWHCFDRGSGTGSHSVADRLRGNAVRVVTNSTAAEDGLGTNPTFSVTMDGISLQSLTGTDFNGSGNTYINHFFRRAPGVFDVVGFSKADNTTQQRISHSLGVAPELIIAKDRTTATAWMVYTGNIDQYLRLDLTNAIASFTSLWGTAAPNSSTFGFYNGAFGNPGDNIVAYLFATKAGISKVGSFTGTGSDMTIDCGFSAGARFVMAKRTDNAGGWFVWDTTRGIVSGNDPYLRLESTAAETTTTDYIDPHPSGFIISSFIVELNAQWIYLAFA